MKVAIVGCVGLPAKYGGFETLVENIVDLLANRLELHVFCSSKAYQDRPEQYRGANLHYVNLEANGISSILYDVVSIWRAIRFADVVLILGVSGCVFLPLFRLLSQRKFVLNVDGLEWRRQKWHWAARKFLKLSERIGVRCAHEVIADNIEIQRYLTNEYGADAKWIAYGGDHVETSSESDRHLEQYKFAKKPYVFAVCRIEPENNLHVILEAFESISDTLVIVGNWRASVYGTELLARHSDSTNIHLLDPIYEQGALDAIRSKARIYVHGHSAGGTNPSLVEAMCLGLPVFAFDVAYNRETTHDNAAYFSDSTSLANLVKHADDASLSYNASQMQSIANTHYRWVTIAERYADVIEQAYSDSGAT